jgi:hypothetical protein
MNRNDRVGRENGMSETGPGIKIMIKIMSKIFEF